MAWSKRKNRISADHRSSARPSKKWAWAVSLALHLCLFAVFAAINLHSAQAREPASVTRADIKTIQEQPLTLPKPSVKSFQPTDQKQSLQPDRSAGQKPAFITAQPQQFSPQINQPLSSPDIAQPRAEFYGSKTSQRKICYVVDCSGSMLGFFSGVRTQLIDSINALKPDQYFYIIFFNDNNLAESGTGRFQRATSTNKVHAIKFINSIRPGGSTNAHNALRRAMLIRDYSGNGPEQIYFLTDGFDFAAAQSEAVTFETSIIDIHARLAPRTRISTIGFWVEHADEQVLRDLARKTRGDFVNIQKD